MDRDAPGADEPSAASRRRVRRHARDVALWATLVALAVYLLMCLAADLTVLDHLSSSIDARLNARLDSLVHTGAARSPSGLAPGGPPLTGAARGRNDLDDAPVFAWWLPAGSTRVHRLDRDGPALPLADLSAGGPRDLVLEHRTFRLVAAATSAGRFAAATSVEELLSIRATLLVAEAAVLPVILLAFFLVAYAIGRRAAAPVERARAQQLDFTADASHELRTPLSVIEAEVGLALSAERSASDLREALERVGTESHRLGGIVEDLLWLARADALPEGGAPFEAVDLAALAQESLARFAPVARHRGLELRLEVGAPPEPIVRAPADWLDRLLSVLLDNACRYVEEAGRIALQVQSVGGRSHLRVDDSGPGIPPAELAGLFRRFHRASFAPGGAGLGLSIADTIVQATGGRWEVGRSPDGGARMGASWPCPSADELGARGRGRRSPAHPEEATRR